MTHYSRYCPREPRQLVSRVGRVAALPHPRLFLSYRLHQSSGSRNLEIGSCMDNSTCRDPTGEVPGVIAYKAYKAYKTLRRRMKFDCAYLIAQVDRLPAMRVQKDGLKSTEQQPAPIGSICADVQDSVRGYDVQRLGTGAYVACYVRTTYCSPLSSY